MQIFAGSSNPDLAKKIEGAWQAKNPAKEISLGEVEISHFPNGEVRVWVKEKKIEKEVVVLQSLSTPTNDLLIEFCLICDALRRGGAREIIAVIPWMGYSKQDKVFRDGEPLSAKVVAQIVQGARVNKIITFDLHNKATLGFFDVPVLDLSAKPLLLEYFRKKVSANMMVAAPDSGAVKESTAFAEELGVGVVYMDKKRDLDSGEVRIEGMSRSVKGAEILIVDDNVFTGSTLLETAKELKQAGAKSIAVGLTHHLYIPGVQEKLEQSPIDEIVVSDSIAMPSVVKTKSSKLKIVSIAELIAEQL
jgi:ribose-phosphate pyrophosphokinase